MVDENEAFASGGDLYSEVVKFPSKVYSEKEVKELWNNAVPHPDLKPYVNRAERSHFPEISRQKPDGYFVALHGGKIVAHCGWKKLEHIYLSSGSKTHPDYAGSGVNKILRKKRRGIFGNNPAMAFLNNSEKWWVDSFLKVGWEIVEELPEPYQDLAPPNRIYLLYNKEAKMGDDKPKDDEANKSFDRVFNNIIKVFR